MFELKNVPDVIFSLILLAKGENITGLRKYQKLKMVEEMYDEQVLNDLLEEFLYSRYGPIDISEIFPIGDFNLSDLEGKKPEIKIGEEKLKYDIVKREPLNANKYLIQLSFPGEYDVIINNNHELKEIHRRKIVNCIIDTDILIMQVRAGAFWAKKCKLVLEKYLSNYFSIKSIKMNDKMIYGLKKKLVGAAFIHEGKKKKEIFNNETPPRIKYKILKRDNEPKDIRHAAEFGIEMLNYDLYSESFHFEIEGEIAELISVETMIENGIEKTIKSIRSVSKSMDLKLTVNRAMIYFRKFPTDHVIDLVLKKIRKWMEENPPDSAGTPVIHLPVQPPLKKTA